MGVYQRDGRWMVYWFDQGKRRDKSFGRGDEAKLQAEKFDNAAKQCGIEAGMVLGNAIVEPKTLKQELVTEKAKPEGITFGKLARMHLDHLLASGKTEKHIKNVAVLLKNSFFPLLGKDRPVDDLTYINDILPFIKHFQAVSPKTGKPRSQVTVNRYCDYLDSIFNFGCQIGLVQSNPMKLRQRIRERPREIQLTVEDMRRIMVCAEPHVRWAMEVCFNLGTRPGTSELLTLQWYQVDFQKSMVKIYASKTNSYRIVPVRPAFLEKLKMMKSVAQSNYIIEFRGKPVTTIRKSFKFACEQAGINYPIRMYDLRHLFATTMLTNNADLAAVSKLMGHSTVKMTADTYYHYMEGEKERAINLLPEIAL